MNESCLYCGSAALRCTHTGLFHPLKTDHGPFAFYKCLECGSGLTLPPPSAESLNALYGSFESGLPEEMRRWRQDAPLTSWDQQCLDHAMARAGKQPADRFLWIDVGAGGGELARLAAAQYPDATGIAVDLHRRPRSLDGLNNVQWIESDINRRGFAAQLNVQADVVISVAVWEHVRRPDWFLEDLVQLVKPNGTLYLVSPDYGSAASRLLGRYWPFFTPGEHLCMPSVEGAKQILNRLCRDAAGANVEMFVRRVSLPYPVRYTMSYFRVGWLGRMFPRRWIFPLPAGVLEAGFTRQVG